LIFPEKPFPKGANVAKNASFVNPVPGKIKKRYPSVDFSPWLIDYLPARGGAALFSSRSAVTLPVRQNIKMKPINATFILIGSMVCSSLWLAGCSNSQASSQPSSSASPSSASSTGASFSAIVDGTKFSSNTGTDNLNAAFVVNDNDGQKKLFFMLADPDNPVQKLNFDLPNKEGSTTISILPKYSFEGYVTSNWTVYVDDGLTVNITSLSATRVSGTFSGNYRLENVNTPNAKQTLQVTDGKFDIPFSTSAQWKKVYHAQ
jgi:hypothetical protein